MFVHRSIYHRNYNYSHPLAGTFYHNSTFQQTCSPHTDSEVKLSTAGSQQLTHQPLHQPFLTKREEPRRHSHSMAANHSRIPQKQGHSRHSLLPNNKNTTLRGTSLPISRNHNSIKNTVPAQESSRHSVRDRKKLKRKLAINHFVDSYLFPSIEIRIINKINFVSEISKHSLNFNFEKIFKKLISTQLMGEFTSNFMLKMEKYIRKIIEEGTMPESRENVVLQQSLKGVSRKNDLLDIIQDIQMDGQNEKVEQIVKYYCVPGKKQSEQILSQLMKDLLIDIYEKKNCRKDIEYCLMTQQGQIIKHMSEIFFTTRVLLLCPLNQHEKWFLNYRKILEDHDRQQRMTFKQSIKHNFVNKIVNNRLQTKLINYSTDPKEAETYRKESQQQAQAMLTTKSKLRLQKHKQNNELKDILPSDLAFNASEFNRLTTYNNYVERKHREKKQYKDILKQLHRMLDPNHTYDVKSKVDKKTDEEFSHLHMKNDKYDITYTHNPDNSNKLLIKNVIENCSVFRSRRKQQIKTILQIIYQIYGNGKEIEELQRWQFKQLFETAHGVSDKKIIMKFVLTFLPFDQFGQVSKQKLFKLIEVAIPFEGRTMAVIQRIIWNVLERTKLVENNALRKRNIEIWYEPVRVVYLLLLSVLFGNEYKSFGEMLTDLSKYQFY